MNKGAIFHWARVARPGDPLTYHRGWHLFEPRAEAETIEAIRVLFNDGLVELVQRKHGPRDFEYIAQRRLDRWHPPYRFEVSRGAESAWRVATNGQRIGPNRF